MASMTNQTDVYTKAEIDTLVGGESSNNALLDARATDNLANIDTTLTSPNPYISSGT